MTPPIVPARGSPRFVRFFGAYACRMLRKRCSSVLLERQSEQVLRDVETHDGPLVVAFNHHSWWDPIVGVALKHIYMPDRPGIAPVEMEMFERFGFMRRLGMFGVDIEHPAAARAFVEYVQDCQRQEPRLGLYVTPQGAFADVRVPIVVRPGTGAVAASLPNVRVIAIVSELVFWEDKRPELLILARGCDKPAQPTTSGWTRTIRKGLQGGADALAKLAIARSTEPFVPMLVRSGSDINPIYDLWQRLRGRRSHVTPKQRGTHP